MQYNKKRDRPIMKTTLIACFVLAVSTVMINEAHSVTVEPPTVLPEEGSLNSVDGKSYSPNSTGQQKGYAYIQFHVFGLERSLKDLASKLELDIDYRVTEDGWFQDKAEYTVTGKVINIVKFYNTIEALTGKFQLTKDPLVLITD